jgi:predicted ester cyclase
MPQAPYIPKAQEARHKAVVERYFYEVLDHKRFELMPELLARDVCLHRPGFDVVGIDAAMQRLRAVLQDYTEFSTELSGTIAEGDMVAVRVLHRARGRAGDVPVGGERALEWRAIVQFRLQDGRIAEEWIMRDELGILLQLGTVSIGT